MKVRKPKAAEVPIVLAAITRAAEDLHETPQGLAIAHRMKPAILQGVRGQTVMKYGSTSIYDAVQAIDAQFLAWSRDEDSLHVWADTVDKITAALGAAGLDSKELLLELREFSGQSGFYVGVTYAYHVLAAGGVR